MGGGGLPPVDGLELDGVGAGGDLERELLALGAVEEVYVLLRLLLAGGGGDLHLVPAAAAGTGNPEKNGASRGGLCSDGRLVFIETRGGRGNE